VAGLAHNLLPFIVPPLHAAPEKIDPRQIESAGDLYASPLRAFLEVTMPLSIYPLVYR
jgi:spermidine/putrescine transport system permease protein